MDAALLATKLASPIGLLTTRELAALLGVSLRTVEHGRPGTRARGCALAGRGGERALGLQPCRFARRPPRQHRVPPPLQRCR